MKFRILFIKKETLFLITFAVLISILFSIYIITKPTEESSTYVDNLITSTSLDINGDGKKEEISKVNDGDDVGILIKYDNKEECLSKLSKTSYFKSMDLFFCDLTRNSIPEVIVNVHNKSNSKIEIFSSSEGKMNKILSKDGNIVGISNSTNNRTPLLTIGEKKDNTLILSTYLLINGEEKKLNINSDYIFGKDTISALISYIENTYYENTPMDLSLISHDFRGESYNAFESLDSNTHLVFDKGSFSDLKYNKDGELSSIKWCLAFHTKEDTTNDTLYNFNVFLELDDKLTSPYCYKIKLISLE